jgi:AraC-like DNA-binding protein
LARASVEIMSAIFFKYWSSKIAASAIARMVGYHDINYFSLAFKKNTGMSPTEYREKCVKQNYK